MRVQVIARGRDSGAPLLDRSAHPSRWGPTPAHPLGPEQASAWWAPHSWASISSSQTLSLPRSLGAHPPSALAPPLATHPPGGSVLSAPFCFLDQIRDLNLSECEGCTFSKEAGKEDVLGQWRQRPPHPRPLGTHSLALVALGNQSLTGRVPQAAVFRVPYFGCKTPAPQICLSTYVGTVNPNAQFPVGVGPPAALFTCGVLLVQSSPSPQTPH